MWDDSPSCDNHHHHPSTGPQNCGYLKTNGLGSATWHRKPRSNVGSFAGKNGRSPCFQDRTLGVPSGFGLCISQARAQRFYAEADGG